jgi:hypothetical protein
MAHTRLITLLALASGTLSAQAPIFADGAALGGSRVFSEGLNPLGNPARFDKPTTGIYLGWAEGDAGAKETKTALTSFADPTRIASGLATLADQSWALRTRALGVAYVEKGMYTSYTREENTSLFAVPDLDSGHLGAGIGLNTTTVDVRRAVVDRLCVGAGSFAQGSGYGISVRVERWKTGQVFAAFLPATGQLALVGQDLLEFQDTVDSTTTTATLDLGFTYELIPGIRFGATVDRLLPHHFGDVYEAPQGRVGFQMDLGSTVQLSVDSDLNKAMRMPFPVPQRITTASLRLSPSPSFTLILGAEQRSLADQALIRGGITLFVHSGSWHVGAGIQAGQDRPMKGAALSVY